MRTERAGGAIDLAQVFLLTNMLELAPKPVHVDGELLAECGRCGRLPVREGEQRHVLELLGTLSQQVDNGIRAR